ncbi:MAG: hypothetical protein LUQ40_06965, partial [Methanomicrobiales archaeon]|nr:hypothetical protein [Methanomicrobiales archaeon]
MENAGNESRIGDLLFILAKNIAKHDPSLSAREIDLAAWEYTGRILFLKTCEEWKRETDGQVRHMFNGGEVHRQLGTLIPVAAQRFGDALLPWDMAHPHGVSVLPFVEDPVLLRVINAVPGPDGRPHWAERVSAGIETALQREVIRDRGGISYADRAEAVAIGGMRKTPAWFVHYCAGSLARDLTEGIPAGANPVVRILDPSCGCGLYLQCVYRALVTGPAGNPGSLPVLCGIDRDPRAVDVARILFLLMMLETNGGETRHIPLRDRIRWGDPIIGHTLHDEEAHWFNAPGSWQHALPIDWAEHFPDASASGGFDGIIGCPPFRVPGVHRALTTHLQEWYRSYPGGELAGVYYAEKGLSLLREGGVLCMALDRRWLRARSGAGLRRLLREVRIREIVDFGAFPVWGQVRTQASVLLAGPAPPGGLFRACRVRGEATDPVAYLKGHCLFLDQRELDSGGWTLADRRVGRLIARINAKSTVLDQYMVGKIYAGLPLTESPGLIRETTRKWIVRNDPLTAPLFRPVIGRKNIAAFRIVPSEEPYVIVVRDMAELALFPGMSRILRESSGGAVPVFCAR